MSNEKKKSRMAYFIACVSEFARAHGLAHHESFDYLDRYKGMDFLVKCYEAEHTLSFADAVNDLNVVCRRHGGRILFVSTMAQMYSSTRLTLRFAIRTRTLARGST